jgi:cobalt-zinc-cadmium efflux system outer membrane protein
MTRPDRYPNAQNTDWCSVFALAAATLVAAPARGETAAPAALDRTTVLSMVARAPQIAVAEARVGEARALRVGAGALAASNPDLTVFGGPRRFPGGERSTDLVFTLLWPLDVSGARSARKEAADGAVAVAEADAADARRLVAAEALELWIASRSAAERVQLEKVRVSLDAELVRIASVRRQAGVAGDSELALASVLASESRARLQEAVADESAAISLLKGKLGLPATQPVIVTGSLTDAPEAPALDSLIARALRRGDVERVDRAVPTAEAVAKRESRSGVPVPRALLGAGRENETFAHVGLDVPIPVYQRNQTSRAVADARVGTAGAEQSATRIAAEAEVRAAHATYLGARDAFQTRTAALPSVTDLEKLAWRSYELGSMPLASVVVSRREAAMARAGHLAAAVTLARARTALERASGSLP